MPHRSVYLAAPFKRPDLPDIVAALTDAGHDITARWLDELDTGTTHPDAAQRDLEDIDRADVVLIVDDLERWSGRHVEAGYAIARGKPIVVLGPASNLFYRTICHHVSTLAAALNALADLR